LNVVFCAAGGWAGGSIKSGDLVANVDKMISMNVHSALQASRIAALRLAPGGLLVLTGAAAAVEGTSGMIAYGITKAATHQLVESMAQQFKKEATCLAILPVTIDTPSNRAGMPSADTSTWTPPDFIARTILGWTEGERPASGSLLKVITEGGKSRLEKA
jgi:dihydropteridine reductase